MFSIQHSINCGVSFSHVQPRSAPEGPGLSLWLYRRQSGSWGMYVAGLHNGGGRSSVCRSGLREHGLDGDADLFSQFAVLAHVHSLCIDGFADLHVEWGGIELLGGWAAGRKRR
jgi:hypothetical protein